jgi:hypothetical protein
MTDSRARRRYRAPAKNRSWLIGRSDEPSPVEIPLDREQPAAIDRAIRSASDAATHNRDDLQRQSINGFELPLAELRREAREELLNLALDSTSALRAIHLSSNGPDAAAPLILTGHQPSLVHPGVWAKNVAADRIARLSGGRSINLVVDTDMLDDRSLRVPERDGQHARLARFDYDEAGPAAPYIEAEVIDEEIFASFGPIATQHMQSQWGITPLIDANWPDVAPVDPNETLAFRFTKLRHAQEVRWSLGNLEVFLSELVSTSAFSRFFLDIARRADEFLDIHNRAVVNYRREHHLRSQSHPVPVLMRDRERIELPFWTWAAGEHTRRPMNVVNEGGLLKLGDTRGLLGVLSSSAIDTDHDMLVEQILSKGIRIAPRALTTTLFCRVWLADLFIHGIGGATYDQMTDRLIREFYGIEPPPFLVLTGTLRLPIQDVPAISADDIHKQQRLLRELEHQPERHLPDASPRLLAEKASLVEEERARASMVLTHDERQALRTQNHARWRRLREINRQLSNRLEERLHTERDRLREYRELLQTRQVLESREFSAWLYPTELLEEFFGSLIG